MTTATMDRYPTEPCASCNAPMIRAVHEGTGKSSVIDADPSPLGSILLIPGATLRYRIVPSDQRGGSTDLHTSHFVTCPDAGSFRRPKGVR